MMPLSRVVGFIIRLLLKPSSNETESEEEILLLAEKSAKEGTLTTKERDMINNALSLDDLLVNEIMTPRTVVHVIDGQKSIACGMRFRSSDRTLGENEVNQAFEKIVEKMNQTTPYTLRT